MFWWRLRTPVGLFQKVNVAAVHEVMGATEDVTDLGAEVTVGGPIVSDAFFAEDRDGNFAVGGAGEMGIESL